MNIAAIQALYDGEEVGLHQQHARPMEALISVNFVLAATGIGIAAFAGRGSNSSTGCWRGLAVAGAGGGSGGDDILIAKGHGFIPSGAG